MQTTWQQSHWLNNNPLQRQLVAFVISVIIVALILLIPISLNYDFDQNNNAIEVILSKEVKPAEPEMENIVERPLSEPNVQKKPELVQPIKKVVEKQPVRVEPSVIEQAKSPIVNDTPRLPSSATIFNSAYGKVRLHDLGDDFKARAGDEDDFKFREIKQPEWNVVSKLIDEDLDKPRVYMNFYSEGILGSTERFFDKISYKKVFTTRYGTKIACGGIGPLVACSWK